jgi:hypothetical protein
MGGIQGAGHCGASQQQAIGQAYLQLGTTVSHRQCIWVHLFHVCIHCRTLH